MAEGNGDINKALPQIPTPEPDMAEGNGDINMVLSDQAPLDDSKVAEGNGNITKALSELQVESTEQATEPAIQVTESTNQIQQSKNQSKEPTDQGKDSTPQVKESTTQTETAQTTDKGTQTAISNPSQRQSTFYIILSPFDQCGPRLYVHKFFIFNFPDMRYWEKAVEYIKQRLSVCILKWPFITGRVAPLPAAKGKKNMLSLSFELPIVGDAEGEILTIKHLGFPAFPYCYSQLAEGAFPPTVMNPELLSGVPEWPTPGWTYPALNIQANFFPGGLILSFAFHHAVADGGSFIAFIKEFGVGGGQFVGPANAHVARKVDDRIDYLNIIKPDKINPLSSYPEYNAGSDFRADNYGPALNKSPKKPVTTRILQFTANRIKILEERVNHYLHDHYGSEAFASNIACLSALVWVGVIRARAGRLNKDAIAKIGIAVNVRPIMKLPEDYFGNAIVHTHAYAKVSDFTHSNVNGYDLGVPGHIPISIIAEAAWIIRHVVKSVDSDYVNSRIATLSSLEDPTVPAKAYAAAMDNSLTGIDFSSWREQGADVDFGIPGTKKGTVDFWRKAWSPNEGAYNILPRAGGSKGSAFWEISLGLSVEDMEAVLGGDILRPWACRELE